MMTVCPGDRLGSVAEFLPGFGTYVRNGFIYASMCGKQHVGGSSKELEAEAASSGKKQLQIITEDALPVVPNPGNIVTVKITRVQASSTSCRVLCVDSQPLTQEFKGVIRQQDVRATEIDKVVMQDCFRPGDVVHAEVLSLGDARSYYLTTAKNELGVVWARSVAGYPMTAVGWEAMQCPETLSIEKRKVAKFVASGPADKRKMEGDHDIKSKVPKLQNS